MFGKLVLGRGSLAVSTRNAWKIQSCNVSKVRIERFMRKHRISPDSDDKVDSKPSNLSLEQFVASIDTTLTPEQQEHVNAIKKKMFGAANKFSEYRNAVALDEVEDDFTSTIRMKNSPELVDWALSHIPKRAGPRKSRLIKRMKNRQWMTRKMAKERKALVKKASEKTKAKAARQVQMSKVFEQEGAQYRATLEKKRMEWIQASNVADIVKARVQEYIKANN